MGRFFTAPRRFFSTTPGEGVETVRHAFPCPALAGMKLAFFSDIHASPRFSDAAMEALFARVAAMEADVVCIGGDFAEDEGSLARLLRFFPLLSPPLGVYACLGNNDRELPGFARAGVGARAPACQRERASGGAAAGRRGRAQARPSPPGGRLPPRRGERARAALPTTRSPTTLARARGPTCSCAATRTAGSAACWAYRPTRSSSSHAATPGSAANARWAACGRSSPTALA